MRPSCRRGLYVFEINEFPAVDGQGLGPPAVQCESRAPPGPLKGDGLARPAVGVYELEMLIGELGGDQAGDNVE